MAAQLVRGCKVNIYFLNFATVAINLLHDPLEIALGHAPHLAELRNRVETAEPPPVVEDRRNGLFADADYPAQSGGVGAVELQPDSPAGKSA